MRESGLGPVLGRLKNDAENITGIVVGKVAGNGAAEEGPQSRAAADSEISVGKPKPAAPSRPTSAQRPATPPSRPPRPRPGPPTPPGPSPPPPRSRRPPSRPRPSRPRPSPPHEAGCQAGVQGEHDEAQAGRAGQAEPRRQAQGRRAEGGAEGQGGKGERPGEAGRRETGAKGPTAKDLPVTGYDEATLASVRARLRGLDAGQVGELRDYERSHAARADFLRMYENRIAKLKGEH